jgi:hypothetical protein
VRAKGHWTAASIAFLARALRPKATRTFAHLTRRARNARRTYRLVLGLALAVIAVAAVVIALVTPKESDKPIVTLYMQPDCGTCQRYAEYLRNHGFRVQAGPASELPALRARFRVPRPFRALHIGIVEGLFIEGHVPTSDIREFLAPRNRGRVRGLVVPGVPRDGPGLSDPIPDPFTVYLVRGSGLVQPFRTYNHIHYWH